MNDQQNSEPKKTSFIDRLSKKKEKLEKELKKTQNLLRQKKAAQTAKQTAKQRKNRTRVLILMGIFSTEQLKDNLRNLSKDEIFNITHQTLKKIGYYYKDKKDNLPPSKKKNEDRLETEMNLLAQFIKDISKEILNERKKSNLQISDADNKQPLSK